MSNAASKFKTELKVEVSQCILTLNDASRYKPL